VNKQAFLEQIREDAFIDEIEKIAAGLNPTWTPMHSGARKLLRSIKGKIQLTRVPGTNSSHQARFDLKTNKYLPEGQRFKISKDNPISALFHEYGHSAIGSHIDTTTGTPYARASGTLLKELQANDNARRAIRKFVGPKHSAESIKRFNEDMRPNYSSYKSSVAHNALFEGDILDRTMNQLNLATSNLKMNTTQSNRALSKLLQKTNPDFHRQKQELARQMIPLMQKTSSI